MMLPGQCSYFDKRCGVVVVYSTLFLSNFLHFQHLSISNDLHRPWECLIQCILPEWVFWKDFFDRKDLIFFFPCGFPEQTKWFTFFQRGNFSEQSILHHTSMEQFLFLILLSVFVFFPLSFHSVWWQVRTWSFGIFPNRCDKHFQPTLATNLLTCTNVCRQAFLQCRATCQTIKMPCSRQSSGWSFGVEFASPNISNWSDKAARLHANTDWCW